MKRPTLLPLSAIFLGALAAAGSAQCELTTSTQLTAPNPQANDNFGAALAIDGNVMVVGATGVFDGGRAHVFRYNGATWAFEQTLTPTAGASFDGFGHAVAVDGDVIAVGAPFTEFQTGMVVVFRHDGANWVEEQTLVPPEVDANDWFGNAVAVEGDWLIGGAPRENCDAQGNECGAAYAYLFTGGAWVQQQELLGGGGFHGNGFGDSLSLDAGTLVVGAPWNEGIAMPPGPGQVDVFRLDGPAWSQVGQMNDFGLTNYAGFGDAVAVSGPDVLAGAPGDDFGGWTDAGSVYFFEESGASWNQIGNPPGPDPDDFDQFALEVAVDQGVAVAGAPWADDAGTDVGIANLYRKGSGTWTPVTKLVDLEPVVGGFFGSAVAVGNGFLAIGARGNSPGGLTGAGEVHVYAIPELVLEVSPPAAGGGALVSLETCGGTPGGLDALVVTSLGGVPTQLILFVGTFDAEGQTGFQALVPPGLAGLTADLVSYGHYLPGVAGISATATFTFQ